ncbi:hypothetical protein FNF27_05026 [Cafeteria roenbergensis]|uniref:Uncharacterized protein n=2 Tax=Cafeteria roenbergensis TaxID=33653 RepID=A0A5A8ECC1_CAFRO|nr:hypothetical protein FNF27_05026 [Cafeteria roenbergensis]
MRRFGRVHEYAGDFGASAKSMLGTGNKPQEGEVRAFVETHPTLVVPGAVVPLGLELSVDSGLVRALQACSDPEDVHRLRVVLLPAECIGVDFLGVLGEVVSVRESHEMDVIACTVHALCYARVPAAFATDRTPREARVRPLRPVLPRPSTALPRRLALATGLRFAQRRRRARGDRVPRPHEAKAKRVTPSGARTRPDDMVDLPIDRFSAAACSRIGCGAVTAQGCWALATSQADWTRVAARVHFLSAMFGTSDGEVFARRRGLLSRQLSESAPSIVRKGDRDGRLLSPPSAALAAAAEAATAQLARHVQRYRARTDPVLPEDLSPVRADESYMLVAIAVTGASLPWLPPSLAPCPGSALRALCTVMNDYILAGDRERADENVAIARSVFPETSGPVFTASNGATARLLVQPPSASRVAVYDGASPAFSYVEDYFWVPLVEQDGARVLGWRFVDAGAVVAALILNTPGFSPRPRLELSHTQRLHAEAVMHAVMQGGVAGFWAFVNCVAKRARVPPRNLVSFRRGMRQWMQTQTGVAPRLNTPTMPACVALLLATAAADFARSGRPACFDATSPQFHREALRQLEECDIASRISALLAANSGLAASLLSRATRAHNAALANSASTCLLVGSILPAAGPGVESNASLWAQLHDAIMSRLLCEVPRADALLELVVALATSGRFSMTDVERIPGTLAAVNAAAAASGVFSRSDVV